MSKQRQVFQFRMEPTALQSEELLRMAGTARFLWNRSLARCQIFYKENKKGTPPSQLSRELTAFKNQEPISVIH
jgi:transposase